MRYTTPEWLLDNLEQRLRLALQQPLSTEQHLPDLDPVADVGADSSVSPHPAQLGS